MYKLHNKQYHQPETLYEAKSHSHTQRRLLFNYLLNELSNDTNKCSETCCLSIDCRVTVNRIQCVSEMKCLLRIFIFFGVLPCILVLLSPFIYPTNAQLYCYKIMLTFTLIFTLKVLLHAAV